jgi:5-methylcytosine-specific restriction endonuclease McrA
LDKKTINIIKQALRGASLKWSVMTDVRNSQRTRITHGTFKNGKPKTRYAFWCGHCGEIYQGLEVDHIKEIGVFDIDNLSAHVKRLFCDRENLIGLCHDCHVAKTNLVRDSLKDL